MWALRGEIGGNVPLLGTLKDMWRRDLEAGVFLHRVPVGELGRGSCFTGDFERQQKSAQ